MSRFKASLSRISAFGSRARLLREASAMAARSVPDKTVDALWVDGLHDFHHVAMDLQLWLPKLRPGALLAGHDHAIPVMSDVAVAVYLAGRSIGALEINLGWDSTFWMTVPG